jgi:Calpain family cysteine protease
VNGNYNNALDLEVPKILTSDIVPFEKEENYGISHNQQLNPITRFDNFFKNEAEKKRTDFSSNLTPVGRCDWYKMHKDIKGEFYDKTFDPEDPKNLMGFEKNTSKYDENLIKYLKDNFNWRRFSYMFPDCRVMGTTIDPRSLFSGFIGDCYFMSALSSLSEHPGRIKRLFNQ